MQVSCTRQTYFEPTRDSLPMGYSLFSLPELCPFVSPCDFTVCPSLRSPLCPLGYFTGRCCQAWSAAGVANHNKVNGTPMTFLP